ncbi:GLABROUS1 enhancer-binding protein family [Dillenia turbinata]|uniref:GLABROUS1 enhancer-binding protein family n=1 Tax=Dillenia turbinata TaxID=194707 RepID=A0AAN8VQU9_9MAGN
MARKRPAMQAPPPANPSSEEESSKEETEEQEEREQEQEAYDEEGEEEEDKGGKKASSPPPPPPPSSSDKKSSKKKATVRPKSSSSTDGADESEEESDGSDTGNPPKIAEIPDPKAKSTLIQRTAENDTEKDSKKAKTDEAATSKKPLFVRFWSQDDEIAILKGLSEYSSKKGIDPFQDMNGFHESVKKSVRADVSKSQLSDKIRRLKKKYKNKVSKGKNGEDPVFTKPHDEKAFVLSRKIWGGEVEKTRGSVQSKKADGKIPKSTKSKGSELADVGDKEETGPEREKNSEGHVCLSQKLGVPAPNEIWMQEGLELIPKSIKNELEEKRMAQDDAEIENRRDILELLRYQGKLVSMALKSKNHSVT